MRSPIIRQISLLFFTLCLAPTLPAFGQASTVVVDLPGVDVITDVGYYISIETPDAITISLDGSSTSSYQGSATFIFETNIQAQIYLDVEAVSAAGGTWTATATPDIVNWGTTNVTVTVRATGLNILMLPGGTTGFKVAELTISVLPLINP